MITPGTMWPRVRSLLHFTYQVISMKAFLGKGVDFVKKNNLGKMNGSCLFTVKCKNYHLTKQGSLPFERCPLFCLIQTSHFSHKVHANWEITLPLFHNTD